MNIYNLKGNKFKLVHFLMHNRQSISTTDIGIATKMNPRNVREMISELEASKVITVIRDKYVNRYLINDKRDWRI